MKNYRIMGGEPLGADTHVAQVLIDEDGKYVATMREVIETLNDYRRLREKVALLMERRQRVRNCFRELTRLVEEDIPE